MRTCFPALILILLLALSGNAAAQSYEEGLKAFEGGDLTQAEKIWQEVAKAGDALGMYGLGKLYESDGQGALRDDAEAARWYERAAKGGVTAALNNLALLYAQGRGVEADRAKAVGLWKEAAERGHPQAQYNLALALYRGAGVERDIEAAAVWFRHAADSGLAEAQFALGERYRLGVGIAQDPGIARTWYERAKAQGHPTAGEKAAQLAALDVKLKEPEPIEPATQTQAQAKAPAAEPAGEPKPLTAAAPEKPKEKTAPAKAMPPAAARDTASAGSASTSAAVPGAQSVPGTFSAWLGSMKTQEGAERLWQEALERHRGALDGLGYHLRRIEVDKAGTFYRVLAGSWPQRDMARAICAKIHDNEDFCSVVGN